MIDRLWACVGETDDGQEEILVLKVDGIVQPLVTASETRADELRKFAVNASKQGRRVRFITFQERSSEVFE